MTRSLQEAKAQVLAGLNEGVTCPCCGQFAKRYRRKLDTTMAAGLCWLVDKSGSGLFWVEVLDVAPKWLAKSGGTLAKLAHWGLIEAKPNDDTTKRASGVWRPTQTGIEVASGRLKVKKYVFIYNNIVEGFSTEELSIQEALGDHFNYAELMTTTPATPDRLLKSPAYYEQFDE